ncbi:MAG: phosphopyruvate hydratase [Clostridia bacterium]|jgi:enolase|nr:phosphopyruvate hydratase [Clostridia bacterium]
MRDYLSIEKVSALEVLDSRGNPTVQVEVVTDGGFCAKAIAPSGASTGKFEAVELRDGDKDRFNGKGVQKAVKNVNGKINKELAGENIYNQNKIDNMLIELDGSDDKSNLGANATIATSMAVARVAARSLGMPLFSYIGGMSANRMPIPMLNILNGGRHASNNISIQEFMIVPKREEYFIETLRKCVKVYNTLKNILSIKGYSVGVGDEGGFAPDLDGDEEAIKYILDAIIKSGFEPGKDFGIALDIAATEMKNEAAKIGKDGYLLWKTDKYMSTDEMIDYLNSLIDRYPIISIEDGLAEEDWNSWSDFQSKVGSRIMTVGDDLYVTNKSRLLKGIKEKASNSILVKPNQIGTITETIETVKISKSVGMKVIMSHRSGETEDTFISDLAVGCMADYIKTGAPARTERVAKYNRLLNIQEILRN